MKILVVTNYYPPSRYGWGYMQLCEEVTDGLAAKGHEIAVLTSTHRAGPEVARSYPVHRLLHLDPDWNAGKSAVRQFFVGRRKRERENLDQLQQTVDAFAPDVLFVWHYIGLSRTLLQAAEEAGDPRVAYYLAGYHPELPDEYIAYWEAASDAPVFGRIKPLLARIALAQLAREGKPVRLKCEHVACVSDYTRRRLVSQGLISPRAVVIHNGVNLAEFSSRREELPSLAEVGLRCIVAGHVKAEKGVHTPIEAMGRLERAVRANVHLSIVGEGAPAYLDHLRGRVAHHGLEEQVYFVPAVPRAEIPDILARHNTLLLPTEYDEPLARSMQEAMALGLLVLGTLTGGTGELLVHERTGLAFEPGDADSLARQFRRVLQATEEASEWATAGQRAIVERFNIRRTIDQTEAFLHNVMAMRS